MNECNQTDSEHLSFLFDEYPYNQTEVVTFSEDEGTFIQLFHQILLFFIVLGRWMLPRGDISRDELSQLLLIFIGTGADIIEFIDETVQDDKTNQICNSQLHLILWACWSVSLVQFCFVFTAYARPQQKALAILYIHG